MPPSSRQSPTPGRWRAIALSLLVHALIVAAAVYGWFTWKHEPPESEMLAIEATVVDERTLQGVKAIPKPTEPTPVVEQPPPEPEPTPEPEPEPEPQPEPEPEPPEEQGPPAPDPAEIRRKEEERLAAEQAEKARKAEQERQRIEREKAAAAKAAADKAAAKKAAAEKAAAEKAAAEKKKADEAAAKKAAEEKAREAREAELRRSLEAEERANAARNSAAAATWHSAIIARIQRAWLKPGTARAGMSCIVLVSQVPGGEVTSVQVRGCQPDDPVLRQSVEDAVYRASPLPTPPPGVPFERNLELTFAPKD